MKQGCERYWFLFSSGLCSGVSKFGSIVVVVAVVVCLTWIVDVSVRSWWSFLRSGCYVGYYAPGGLRHTSWAHSDHSEGLLTWSGDKLRSPEAARVL